MMMIGVNPNLLWHYAIDEENDDPITFWMVVKGEIAPELITVV